MVFRPEGYFSYPCPSAKDTEAGGSYSFKRLGGGEGQQMSAQPTDFLKEGPLPASRGGMWVEAAPLGGWEVVEGK